MFGVDRFDAILPPGTGAIMAVGASQPTVVGTKDGRIGMKNQMQWKQSKPSLITFIYSSRSILLLPPKPIGACREAMAAPGRAEVDTSRAFRSVKEAVAVFGERILARETQFKQNAIAHGDRLNGREKKPRSSSITIAAPNAKPEVSDDGVTTASGVLLSRESHSKASATYNVSQRGSSHNLSPVRVTRPVVPDDDVPMYLVPSSPPFFASSPSLANDDFQERERKDEAAADLMVLSSIKKLEEEAARTRQEVAQLKKRVAEMELSMATLNAKLHRALSKLAHMEADKAAAERASIIERGRSGELAALALWAEGRRAPPRSAGRPPLGHLMRFGDGGGEAVTVGGEEMVVARRKVQKRKPIVPLVLPMINGLLFSNKRRAKDKESVYMKELYSLLRMS
ncbi:hypothetical protein PR202_gb00360 [Eleusine coracana subsp. coracana]|uniref:Uncharacterized protein n=1 Tax=Eleusine coracana subsp. coracana TaxID=191504 RepID=A0AAV5DTV1_ELECO|nr:hypothetical protein PR202_gb00360 [Eleusine coracana subsp. coracana]